MDYIIHLCVLCKRTLTSLNVNLVHLLHAVMVCLLKAILSVLVFYGVFLISGSIKYVCTHYCAATCSLPAISSSLENVNHLSSLATEDVRVSLDYICGVSYAFFWRLLFEPVDTIFFGPDFRAAACSLPTGLSSLQYLNHVSSLAPVDVSIYLDTVCGEFLFVLFSFCLLYSNLSTLILFLQIIVQLPVSMMFASL